MQLLHYTLSCLYPTLYRYLIHLTESEIQNLPEDHFAHSPIDESFRDFYRNHILLLREIDQRLQTLRDLKTTATQYIQVLQDLRNQQPTRL